MPALLRSLARNAAPGLLFFLAACQPSPVATVNGRVVSAAELAAQVSVMQSGRPAGPGDASLRGQALDQLIQWTLLEQAAQRAGLDRDPDVEAAVKAQTVEQRARLEQALRDVRAQLKVVDESVRQRVLVEAWSRHERGGLTITAQDLRAAYDLRAQRQPLPPFAVVRDQLLEQLILEKLVQRERPHADVTIKAGALR